MARIRTAERSGWLRRAGAESERPRPGALVALGVGAVVFALVVWFAFWLGFERMRPDLGLDAALRLGDAPAVGLAGEQPEWELIEEGEPAAGRGPQYASTPDDGSAICVLTWQVGSVTPGSIDLSAAMTDLTATRAVLAAAGLPSADGDRVRVRTDHDETLELLHLPQQRADGLIAATASRAFVGSHHYLIVSLICEEGGDVSAVRMNDVLGGVEVRLDIAA